MLPIGDIHGVTHLPTGDLLPTGDVPVWFMHVSVILLVRSITDKNFSKIYGSPQLVSSKRLSVNICVFLECLSVSRGPRLHSEKSNHVTCQYRVS